MFELIVGMFVAVLVLQYVAMQLRLRHRAASGAGKDASIRGATQISGEATW